MSVFFAGKVMELRKKNGWTQEVLAEKLDVHRNAITAWESGQSDPGALHLRDLAELCGVTMDSLYGGSQEDAQKPASATLQEQTLVQNADTVRYAFKLADRVLELCGRYLDGLPSQYFEKGRAQYSKYGIGYYFFERYVNNVLWIGLSPSLQGDKARFAFSVAVNSDRPYDKSDTEGDLLSKGDGDEEYWIYIPIDIDLKKVSTDAEYEQFRLAANKAVQTALRVSRRLLDSFLVDTEIGMREVEGAGAEGL